MNTLCYYSCIQKYKLYLCSVLLLLASATAMGQQKQGLTPLDVAKLQRVENALITPNGNGIAYTLSEPADPLKENATPDRHLYMLDLLSGEPVPFVTSMDVGAIKFRPKHNSITFLARPESAKVNSLFEISLTGGEARKIYSFSTAILDYDWDSEGERLAFIALQPPSATKKDTSSLPYQPDIYEGNIPMQRGYIAHMSRTQYKPEQLLIRGSVYQMHWSPDGSRLAVAVSPTALMDDYHMKQRVLIMDREGELTLSEVEHRGKLGQVQWSPDGRYLAMTAGENIHDPVAGRLFVVSADGGKPNNLRPDFKGMFEQFQWANNQTIHFLASTGVWSVYGKINKDGSSMQAIIKPDNLNLSGFSRSKSGTTAFIADSPRYPAEIHLMKKNEQAPSRLTNSNPWLNERFLGRQEVVTWQTSDSLKLQGMLVYPIDYKKGKPYPLITMVHGGPEDHYDQGWLTSYSDLGQVGASRGFFVFYPNYRGSTGRGVAFAKSSQGDMAGAEFDDIVEGVDQLTAVGIADDNRVGVAGASYGGYAAAWLSTRYTERFAAGVMLAGASNNISKWGTSDIPRELYLVHMRRHVWEDYKHYLKRSPIYYAGQTKTPLLIATGKDDTRVHPGQSRELYRHIKSRTDTPVRLVLYPGEGHGLSRSTAQLDYNLRMLRWLEKHMNDKTLNPGSELKPHTVDISK